MFKEGKYLWRRPGPSVTSGLAVTLLRNQWLWPRDAGKRGSIDQKRVGDHLELALRIPDAWPGFEATINIADTRYTISVQMADPSVTADTTKAWLNDEEIEVYDGCVRVALDGGTHNLTLVLGRAHPMAKAV